MFQFGIHAFELVTVCKNCCRGELQWQHPDCVNLLTNGAISNPVEEFFSLDQCKCCK